MPRWLPSKTVSETWRSHRVNALDPVAFASIPVLLIGVAALAVWVPARRASQWDPVIALRSE